MVKVLCIPCNAEYPDDITYKAHKMQIHGKGVPTSNGVARSLPPGITPDMLPNPDFMQTVQRIESGKTEPGEALVTTAEPLAPLQPLQQAPALPVKDVQPIVLTYRYEGDCPIHTLPVETLYLDIRNAHMVLAYCGLCKTNKAQQQVVPLDKQTTGKRAKNESQKGVKKEGEK